MRHETLGACLFLMALSGPALAQSCVPPPSGLVSWWPGDGNANDIVGGNNGTPQNGATFASGEVGEAFSLNGIDQYVSIPHNDDLNPTGPFSVDAWIKANPQQSSPDGQFLIVDTSHGWTDGTGWALQGNPDGTVSFLFGKGGSTGSPSNFVGVNTVVSVLDNQWHHLGGVFTGAEFAIYLDGGLQTTLAFTGSPVGNTRDAEIGRSWGGGTPNRYFRGLVDEVEFFNRALSESEIQAIYGAGTAGKCKAPTTTSSTTTTATTSTSTTTLRPRACRRSCRQDLRACLHACADLPSGRGPCRRTCRHEARHCGRATGCRLPVE